ncbi:MAG TPA: hypothetical protein VGH35_13660 [Gaiellaceae bacterium]|jgi:hypothetical protein
MEWAAIAERARARYERAGTDVLRGNVAYGTGLALLMAAGADEARRWFEKAASAWRESWADATPTSWGRPIGVIKALLLAGDDQGAADASEWALSLGCEGAESPIGRYAATLALLTLGRFDEARREASSLRERDDFPQDVADALAFIAAHDVVAYAEAAESVLTSFETRDEYLEAVPVADTVLVLQVLAARRGIAADLPESPVLPA